MVRLAAARYRPWVIYSKRYSARTGTRGATAHISS